MRTGKGNREDEEYEEEELVSKKEGTSSTPNNTTNARNKDKASAIRSKHSVTEQRRRSKINERFQILRNLIPHSDQKRDTASFLLEVIEYVQYLHEKVQKYEGSYQGWSLEPTKLMPWRNSHWRVQSFAGQPQTVKNGLGPASSFPGKFEDNPISITPSMNTSAQNTVDSDHSRDIASKSEDKQSELVSKGTPLTMPQQMNMAGMARVDGVLDHSLQGPVCDAQSSASELLQQEELSIEGGTISISSAYSEGLLNNLTQALQSAGLDLTQASISVQINLGKRADKGLTSGSSLPKDNGNPSSSNQAMGHTRDLGGGEDSDISLKRLKT